MVARVLLGMVAALRAVLIPGQAEVMSSAQLKWPQWRRRTAPANVGELDQPGLLRTA